MQKLEKCYVGKPDAGKLARPVWRGLGGNVFRKEQRAALPPYVTNGRFNVSNVSLAW